MILGVDEVGRGALAGPMVLGFCLAGQKYDSLTWKYGQFTNSDCPQIFIDQPYLRQVNDSKKLSAKLRESLVHDIQKDKTLKIFTVSVSNQLIDQYGLGNCLHHVLIVGIVQALKWYPKLEKIYLDGKLRLREVFDEQLLAKIQQENSPYLVLPPLFQNTLPTSDSIVSLPTRLQKQLQQLTISTVKADEKFLPVALASIMTKVQRDQLMTQLAMQYPQFAWEVNKGYATQKHRAAISQYSVSKLHRQSFCEKLVIQDN